MARSQFLGLRGNRLKTALVVLVVAPSFILFGYNNGSTGGISSLESFVHQFPMIDTVNTKGAQKAHNARIKGVVTGSYDLGAVLGSLLCIGYSDHIGRLRTTLLGLILSIIGLALQSSAYSIGQFAAGRTLIGVAIGTISAAIPVWQSECSAAAHRGAFVLLEGVFISSGITLSEWVSFGLSFTSSAGAQWRVPLVFPVIFSIFVIPFIFLMPESPRWLVKKGRVEDAKRTLAALEDEDEDSERIQEVMAEIEQSLSLVKGSLKELAKNGEERLLHRTLLAACGQMFQQMCGISALVFYTTTVFQNLGFTGTKAKVLGACLTTFQSCASIIPLFLVDRFGRRNLFMLTAAGLAITTAIIAGTSGQVHSAVSMAAVVFVFAYDLFFPIGFLGQPFLYAIELAPLKHRVPISAVANATQWLCQFVVAQVTPPGTANLANRYWIIYAVLNAAFVPMIYFLFPETNGRSLEEMDAIFRESKSVFDVVKVARRLPRQEKAHAHTHRQTESENSSTDVQLYSSKAQIYEDEVAQAKA